MNFHGLEFDGVPTDQDAEGLEDTESVTSLIDEDVDFNHVYALFEFPAMVEGQVTVYDGEKLTLLDDSNSYWWLVQVLRNNQIGYIPADNVETANEKLARVNRHKNLKLCMADPEHIVSSRVRQVPSAPSRRVQFSNTLVTQVFVTAPVSDDDDADYDDEEDEDEEFFADDNEGVVGSSDSDYGGKPNREAEHYGDDWAQSSMAQSNDGVVANSTDNGVLSDDDSDYGYYYRPDSERFAPTIAGASSSVATDEGSESAAESHQEHAAADRDSDIVSINSSDARFPRASFSNSRATALSSLSSVQIAGEDIGSSDSDSDDNSPLGLRGHSVNGNTQDKHVEPSPSFSSHMVSGAADYYPSNEDSDEGDSIMATVENLNTQNSAEEPGRYTFQLLHSDVYSRTEGTVTVFSDEMVGEVLRRAINTFGIPQAKITDYQLYAKVPNSIVPLSTDTQMLSFLDYLHDARLVLPDSGTIDGDACSFILADKSISRSRLLLNEQANEDDPYMNLGNSSRTMIQMSIPRLHTSEAQEDKGQDDREKGRGKGKHQEPDQQQRELPKHSTAFSVQDQSIPADNKSDQMQIDSEEASAPENPRDLPDSRQVVQGLLRKIQPPKSKPPPSAIERAKRNTLQLTTASASPSPLYTQARSSLSRSASAGGTNKKRQNKHTYSASPLESPEAPEPTEPLDSAEARMVPSIDTTSAALGQSESTLRSSSETAQESPSPVAQEGNRSTPLHSPTESSDTTASNVDLCGSSNNNSNNSSSNNNNSSSIVYENGLMDPKLNIPEELPLDDWLLILRGWSDQGQDALYRSLNSELVGSESIRTHVEKLKSVDDNTQTAINDILSVSQGVGRRLDVLERELDDIARILVSAI